MKLWSTTETHHHSWRWVRYFSEDLPLYAVPSSGFKAHTPIQPVFKLLQCWVGALAFKLLISQDLDPASLRNNLYIPIFPSLEQASLRLILSHEGICNEFFLLRCFLCMSDISHLPFIAPCSQLQPYLPVTLQVVKWPAISLLTGQTPCFSR